MDFKTELSNLLRARFPYLYISSYEEDRVLEDIENIVADVNLIKTNREVFTWKITEGICNVENNKTVDNTSNPINALDFIKTYANPSVFIFMDFHIYFKDSHNQNNAPIIRKLRDLANDLEEGQVAKNVIFLSPSLILPTELEKLITVVDYDLPTYEEIEEVLDEMLELNTSSGIAFDLEGDDKEKMVKAAMGLTLQEAENAFALAIVNNNSLTADDIPVVLSEKKQLIQKGGLLEFIDDVVSIDKVGGLENVKNWLSKRNGSWLDSAQEYNLPAPKGVLLTGVPGCGKSLIAKSISSMWGLPLIRMDISRMFNGIVGSSEQNMRMAIQTAESVAPSILWIDEIEKGFSGVSAGNDGGVSSHIFGIFLSWMQERKKPVFIIATANNINVLPPEFLRKGRFDEIFFVDLPTFKERKKIFEVHLNSRLTSDKVKGDLIIDDNLLSHLAELSDGFSGSEIEQAVISALFESFYENRSVTVADFDSAIKNTVPLSVTQEEQILALREWSKMRAVTATIQEDRDSHSTNDDTSSGGRILDF